jgi:hypothetical protein
MAVYHDMSAELVRQLLDYDQDTGNLRWKTRTPIHFSPTQKQTAADRCKNWNSNYAGKIAGHRRKNQNYISMSINSKGVLAHRAIWLIMTGEWPKNEIDHRNGDGYDNRWVNLRAATPSQNQHNKGKSKRNKSGFTGVTSHPSTNKWRARICLNWSEHNLGYFDTKEDAAKAYLEAKAKLHPFQPIPRGK